MSLVKSGLSQEVALTTNSASHEQFAFDTIELAGHDGPVFSIDYDPQGDILASGSMDKTILLWQAAPATGSSENLPYTNIGQITGHKGAITRVVWSRETHGIYSSSSDSTVGLWDTSSGQRLRKFSGHDAVVNDICVSKRGTELLASASDDGSLRVWDHREKTSVLHIPTEFPIMCVSCDSTASQLFSAGVDNAISWWDTRNPSGPVALLEGHGECYITSVCVFNDESLVSFGSDNMARTWNIQPYVAETASRQLAAYTGASCGPDLNLVRARWSPDGSRIASGSADETIVVWDAATKKILAKTPGHLSTVTEACFHPRIPGCLASASIDGTVRIQQYSSAS